MPEENVIFEKYITEIAFTPEHEPKQNYFIVFWMAENYQGSVDYFVARGVENAADLISLGDKDKIEQVKNTIESRAVSLFYAIEKQEDNEDITLIICSQDADRAKFSSLALSKIYESNKDNLFNILKIEGIRIR